MLFVVGTVTALVGYFGGNYFLDREGIGMALEGDVLRAMYGSGLYLAGIGLFTVAVGFLLRHTAGTISIVLALMLILGNMVMLVPGALRRLAREADARQRRRRRSPPRSRSTRTCSDPGTGFGVFLVETAVLLGLAWSWSAAGTPDAVASNGAGNLLDHRCRWSRGARPVSKPPVGTSYSADVPLQLHRARAPTSSPTPSASCCRPRSTTRSPRRSWWCRPRAWSAG